MERENFYSIIIKVHNKASGSWASSVTYTTKDERDARANYGSEQSRLFGSKDFDFVCVSMADTFGNTKSEFVDDRPAPEPEPNAE